MASDSKIYGSDFSQDQLNLQQNPNDEHSWCRDDFNYTAFDECPERNFNLINLKIADQLFTPLASTAYSLDKSKGLKKDVLIVFTHIVGNMVACIQLDVYANRDSVIKEVSSEAIRELIIYFAYKYLGNLRKISKALITMIKSYIYQTAPLIIIEKLTVEGNRVDTNELIKYEDRTETIPCWYDSSEFSNGITAYMVGGWAGAIDSWGNLVAKYIELTIKNFIEG